MFRESGIHNRSQRFIYPALLVLGACFLVGLGDGQGDETATGVIIITNDHPVDAATSELPHVEPHLAIDPHNPDRLLAGSIVVSAEDGGPWHCAAFFSEDGGQHWNRHDFDMDRCIDPWALIANNGDLVLGAIDFQLDRAEEEQFSLKVFRSRDDGETWTGPEDLGGQHDHEMILQEPDGGLVLVSRRRFSNQAGFPRYDIGLMRAADERSPFRTVSSVRPGNLAQTATGLVRLSDGALIVTYIDFQRNIDGFQQQGILRQPRAWAVRSVDGGKTFTEPLFVSEGCGATDGFAGYPALAVDSSGGPFRDRLYHGCVAAGFEGLVLTTSDNHGETWSVPRRIDGQVAGHGAHVRTPMLAVNQEGVLAAAWYDRRNDPEGLCQDVFMTYSRDGGSSFATPIRLSGETSCPLTDANGRAARSWAMGGDYGSLSAAADGQFHLLWADSRGGHFQIRHSAFRIQDPL